jgi:ABC-type uncharacterized transport system permease subunit
LAFLILLCYGGGFGTMPAFATDYFGAAQIGSIYGLMLTAWGAPRYLVRVWWQEFAKPLAIIRVRCVGSPWQRS